ncbi:MAG: glycosyltransferase family 2 protein [Oscillospiraceae bacterium]|nr:glycosyltransferase family 2 protein [Oscillospiraceae bacterium]
MRILVIIPAYNEEGSILSVIEELSNADVEVDYVVINDCSTDTTLEILEANSINRINLPCNLGIGGAIQTGYLYALNYDYDIAVQLDGDGQHDPKYLHSIIDPVAIGEADICIGSRFIQKDGFQTSFMRRLGIRLLSFIIKLCAGVKVTDATSGFRACNKAMIAHYAKHYAQDYPEPEAIVSAALYGYKYKEIPVVMRERTTGTSSISAFKSIYFMSKVSLAILIYRLMITSNKPRRN